MRRIGLSLCALVLAVLGVQSCAGAPDVPGEGSLASSARNKCAGYTGGLIGDLNNDVQKAREIAREIAEVDSKGKSTQKDGKHVLLMPTCESRKLGKKDLDNGRFIGVLTGEGTHPQFSATPDDTVYWWVYGEEKKTSKGKDTIEHRSQFLSLNDTSLTPIMNYSFIVCEKKDAKELKVDSVDFISPATCPPHDTGMLHGHHPWFGCKLGCCFAVMPA